MHKFDRIYQLHRVFSGRCTPVALSDLMRELECSRATALRLIAVLRDRLGAPIRHDAEAGGYRYQPTSLSGILALLTHPALYGDRPGASTLQVPAVYQLRRATRISVGTFFNFTRATVV